MTRFFAFIAVFALCSVLTTENTSASSLATEDKKPGAEQSAASGSGPLFSTDVDLILGQKKRRRSGGGRVWANLYYGDTTLKPKEEEKMRPNFTGFQVGFDAVRSRGNYSTYFLNVNRSKIKFSPGGSSQIDNFLLGYGKTISLSMCHFTFAGSLGYDQYEVSAGSTDKGDGLQTNLFGEFGLDFILGKWGIRPFYALQYDFLYHGNIGNLPVLVSDWNGHGLQQLFGLRLSWKITDMLELQSRAVWVHELLDNPPPFYHVRFSPVQGTNTPAILFYEGKTGRDWAWLGIGGKFEGVYNIYLFFDYDVLLNKYHVTHLGSLGLCLGW
jgi:uncharacterized protein with beta-barrel porin domain